MMMKSKNNGEYFGYPNCCIKSFHVMLQKKLLFKDISEVRKNSAKNGFVPCLTCAKKIVAGKIKIEDLILPTRECPRPFSRGGNY